MSRANKAQKSTYSDPGALTMILLFLAAETMKCSVHFFRGEGPGHTWPKSKMMCSGI